MDPRTWTMHELPLYPSYDTPSWVPRTPALHISNWEPPTIWSEVVPTNQKPIQVQRGKGEDRWNCVWRCECRGWWDWNKRVSHLVPVQTHCWKYNKYGHHHTTLLWTFLLMCRRWPQQNHWRTWSAFSKSRVLGELARWICLARHTGSIPAVFDWSGCLVSSLILAASL